MMLPLLPKEIIVPAFRELEEDIDDDDLSSVFGYFNDVLINEFPIDTLCQYDALHRTNNIAEAFILSWPAARSRRAPNSTHLPHTFPDWSRKGL